MTLFGGGAAGTDGFKVDRVNAVEISDVSSFCALSGAVNFNFAIIPAIVSSGGVSSPS